MKEHASVRQVVRKRDILLDADILGKAIFLLKDTEKSKRSYMKKSTIRCLPKSASHNHNGQPQNLNCLYCLTLFSSFHSSIIFSLSLYVFRLFSINLSFKVSSTVFIRCKPFFCSTDVKT